MLAKGWGVTGNVKNCGLILAQRILLLGLSLLFATSSARAQDWNLRFDGNNDAKGRAGVAVNSSGMIVIAGSVCGTLAHSCFNPLSSTYVGSAFVWELDPQDNTLWRHEVGNLATSELI